MNNNKRVLIVDDDTAICDLLSQYLQKHGFQTSHANDTKSAERIIQENQKEDSNNNFHIIVLDIMMPGENGISFAKRLREENITTPIIFLSAMGETKDRINGLQSGGNDYLVKPFDPKELLLRIKNLINMNKDSTENNPKNNKEKPGKIEFGPYLFNMESLSLHNKETNEEIYLTSTEAKLLYELSLTPNEPVDRDTLSKRDGINLSAKTIDVQINRLRNKIEENSKEPKYIKTIRHKGYQLSVVESV